MADALLEDLERVVSQGLSKLTEPPPIPRRQGFHH
jgi:hypothetical protein